MKLLRMRSIALRRVSTASSASSGPSRTRNWLEDQCGDVPSVAQAKPQDLGVSEMIRGGHAAQFACAKLLDATLGSTSRASATLYSRDHVETLQELKALEEKAVERIQHAVETDHVRFRPSALLPVIHCSSALVGTALSFFGEEASTSYLKGVKMAVSDYYNDQIREIYEFKPDEVELKELFKTSRDEELAFVDAHSPDILDENKPEEDTVTKLAKMSTKVLIQAVKTL